MIVWLLCSKAFRVPNDIYRFSKSIRFSYLARPARPRLLSASLRDNPTHMELPVIFSVSSMALEIDPHRQEAAVSCLLHDWGR